MNYTPEITAAIKAAYEENPTRETVEELARTYEKSVKSIIGKLSREGIYRRQAYTTKQGFPPITKEEIVASIAKTLGLEAEDLYGLDKTPKLILQKLEKVVIQLTESS